MSVDFGGNYGFEQIGQIHWTSQGNLRTKKARVTESSALKPLSRMPYPRSRMICNFVGEDYISES